MNFYSKWKNPCSKVHSPKETRKRKRSIHYRQVTCENLTPTPLYGSPNSVINYYQMLTHEIWFIYSTLKMFELFFCLTYWFRAFWWTSASPARSTCPAAPQLHRHERTMVHLIRIPCQSCEVHNEHSPSCATDTRQFLTRWVSGKKGLSTSSYKLPKGWWLVWMSVHVFCLDLERQILSFLLAVWQRNVAGPSYSTKCVILWFCGVFFCGKHICMVGLLFNAFSPPYPLFLSSHFFLLF